MISYAPLWRTMKQKNITTYTLIFKEGFNSHTIHNLKHNQSITAYTMERLCQVLDCTPNDIIEFLPDDDEARNS